MIRSAQHANDLKRLAADGFDGNGEILVPDCVRAALRALVGQIDALDEAIAAIDKELAASVRGDETARRLMTIPGVGPVTARKGSASGAAHGERAPVSWAKIFVADFGGTGVSECAVGNTARDTSGSKSTGKLPRFPGREKPLQFRSVSEACRGLRTEFPPFSRVLRLNSPASLSPLPGYAARNEFVRLGNNQPTVSARRRVHQAVAKAGEAGRRNADADCLH